MHCRLPLCWIVVFVWRESVLGRVEVESGWRVESGELLQNSMFMLHNFMYMLL